MTAAAAAAHRAVGVDDYVPDLTGGATGTAVELAVDDDSATDTGADGDEDQVAAAAPGAFVELAIGRQMGIVLEMGGHARGGLEQAGDRDVVPPGQVRGVEEHALHRVAGAGDADAGGAEVRHRQPVVAGKLFHHLSQGLDALVGSGGGVSVAMPLVDHLTGFVPHRHAQVGATDVDAENMAPARAHAGPSAAAATRRPPPVRVAKAPIAASKQIPTVIAKISWYSSSRATAERAWIAAACAARSPEAPGAGGGAWFKSS